MTFEMISTALADGQTCPTCGASCEVATGIDVTPEPGALMVCYECGAINLLDDALHLRAVTSADLKNLDAGCLLRAHRMSVAIKQRRAERN